MKPAKLVLYAAAWNGLALPGGQSCLAQATAGGGEQPEIVVTAQRRPERPEDVPISLTARSGEELDRLQVTDMAGLGRVVPSLTMTRTGPFTQPYLRGIGKRSTLGVENGVATYIDGVYLASPIGALQDLRGVERVEVLNGPQGTLFGRNATGGVIQIVTQEPDPGFSGEARLDAGSYGQVRGDVYLSGGSDRIAGNFAFSLSRNGAYGTNLFTGKSDQGEVRHSLVVRSRWIWRPSASLTLTLAGDYQDVDQDFTYLAVRGYRSLGLPRVQDFRDADQDRPNYLRSDYGGGSIRADADLGGMTLMSLTAVRTMHARYGVDLDRGPLPLLAADPVARQDQFSQEFQLQSGESSRIRWVLGLYFLDLGERYDPTPFDYGGSYSALLGGRTRQTLFSSGTATSYAAYAQGSLPIGEATTLTLGLRYTIEDRSVKANGERLFDIPPFVRPIPGLPLLNEAPLRNSASFDELTWRGSLDHHFSGALTGYLVVSRGFQSGGWNFQTPQNPAFGPETLDDFEAGLKYVDRARRFRADANVFFYDYSDLQVTAFSSIGSTTANAASARLYGLELQLDARLDDRTDVMAGLQWLEARYDRFPNAGCVDYSATAASPLVSISCDATGNHLPFAPELKLNFGATHRIPLGTSGILELSGNLAYNSGYFSEADNVVRQTAFATADVSAEWRPVRRGPRVRLWVLNLTDAKYYSSLVTLPTVGVVQGPAAPRRFGASIAYDF